MDLSLSTWICLGVVAFLALLLIYAALKGIVKILLLAAAIIGGILTYFWLQKHGFTYLSFFTASSDSWMVTTLSVVGALLVFGVFQQGLSWFSHIFSWGEKGTKLGGAKGIMTTLLMGLFILWLLAIGLEHFGALSDISRYKEITHDAQVRHDPSWLSQAKYRLEKTALGAFLQKINPLYDAERFKLAKIIAYLGSEASSDKVTACLNVITPYLGDTHKLKKIAEEKNIQAFLKQGDMNGLLNSPRLTKLLSEEKTRGSLKQFEPDRLFGMSYESPTSPLLEKTLEKAPSQRKPSPKHALSTPPSSFTPPPAKPLSPTKNTSSRLVPRPISSPLGIPPRTA